jgi:hypothetical protein
MSDKNNHPLNNLSSIDTNRRSNYSANARTRKAEKFFPDPIFNDYTESAFEYENTRQKAINEKHRQRALADASLQNATKRNKKNKRKSRYKFRRLTKKY